MQGVFTNVIDYLYVPVYIFWTRFRVTLGTRVTLRDHSVVSRKVEAMLPGLFSI